MSTIEILMKNKLQLNLRKEAVYMSVQKYRLKNLLKEKIFVIIYIVNKGTNLFTPNKKLALESLL